MSQKHKVDGNQHGNGNDDVHVTGARMKHEKMTLLLLRKKCPLLVVCCAKVEGQLENTKKSYHCCKQYHTTVGTGEPMSSFLLLKNQNLHLIMNARRKCENRRDLLCLEKRAQVHAESPAKMTSLGNHRPIMPSSPQDHSLA